MKNRTAFRLLISLFFVFTANILQAKENTFVSLAPSITEIMYALGAENQLLAVSTECNYPKQAQNKEKIGNTYFLNKEKILELSPDYLLTVEGAQFEKLQMQTNSITSVKFTMNSVNAVYTTILELGKLTDKNSEAKKLVNQISAQINNLPKHEKKRILYLIQLNPVMTIGNKSYISDVIRKSGQINVTDDLNTFYPAVSYEYLIKTNPDVIVISFKSDYEKIKKLFPNAKIIFLTAEQNSIINRPGPRIFEAVKFFANISDKK